MKERTLSVIMPVYNEKHTIRKIVKKVLELDILKERAKYSRKRTGACP